MAVTVKIGKGIQSNTTMSIKMYLMTIIDNYMFRLLLAVVRLAREYHRIQKLHYAIRSVCRDLCITWAHNVYSRTLSSLQDNLKMASKGRNMQLPSIAIKYILNDIVVSDYIPFPIITYTTGMTHFLGDSDNYLVTDQLNAQILILY